MERLEQFEKMYAYIRQNHQETVEQLEKLRGENRQKEYSNFPSAYRKKNEV